MSTVRPVVEPKVTQIHVPRDASGRLVDSGRWREEGVTHWHLFVTEFQMIDRARWEAERVERARRQRPTHGVARSPHEVAAWMVRERSERSVDRSLLRTWADVEEMSFWFAMNGKDSLGLARLSDERIAHLDAYAMTARECSAPH